MPKVPKTKLKNKIRKKAKIPKSKMKLAFTLFLFSKDDLIQKAFAKSKKFNNKNFNISIRVALQKSNRWPIRKKLTQVQKPVE
jgi:hypothetical protein